MTDKRTVVVTGGSRGIGRAVVVALAAIDAVVYFNYASAEDAARETETAAKQAGGTAIGICADLGVSGQVDAFFARVLEETGRIDVLVNNAGVARDGLLVRMKESDWDYVMDINLKGAFLCSKIAAKAMMKQRYGRIIHISSLAGAAGNAGQANYSAAKAGLMGLAKSMARELASRNITVNAVAPGYVETDMTHGLSEKQKTHMTELIPLGRPGTSREVADAVEFLASEKASYITGQTLHVNGGMYI